MDRRSFIVGGAAAIVAAACSGDSDGAAPAPTTSPAEPSPTPTTAPAEPTPAPTTAPAESSLAVEGGLAALTAAEFDAVGTCVLLPEMSPGPVGLEQQFDRRDITEGYPGHPLRLGLRVRDADCAPLGGAVVEVWHADATGDYSAFTDGGTGKDEGSGTTFLRGTQRAGADGIVDFQTIVPGWYPGRAVHIHVGVRLDDETALVTQLFFDEDYLTTTYASEPYAPNGLPDTSNATDFLAGDVSTDGTLLSLAPGETHSGPGTVALLNIGVR